MPRLLAAIVAACALLAPSWASAQVDEFVGCEDNPVCVQFADTVPTTVELGYRAYMPLHFAYRLKEGTYTRLVVTYDGPEHWLVPTQFGSTGWSEGCSLHPDVDMGPPMDGWRVQCTWTRELSSPLVIAPGEVEVGEMTMHVLPRPYHLPDNHVSTFDLTIDGDFDDGGGPTAVQDTDLHLTASRVRAGIYPIPSGAVQSVRQVEVSPGVYQRGRMLSYGMAAWNAIDEPPWRDGTAALKDVTVRFEPPDWTIFFRSRQTHRNLSEAQTRTDVGWELQQAPSPGQPGDAAAPLIMSFTSPASFRLGEAGRALSPSSYEGEQPPETVSRGRHWTERFWAVADVLIPCDDLPLDPAALSDDGRAIVTATEVRYTTPGQGFSEHEHTAPVDVMFDAQTLAAQNPGLFDACPQPSTARDARKYRERSRRPYYEAHGPGQQRHWHVELHPPEGTFNGAGEFAVGAMSVVDTLPPFLSLETTSDVWFSHAAAGGFDRWFCRFDRTLVTPPPNAPSYPTNACDTPGYPGCAPDGLFYDDALPAPESFDPTVAPWQWGSSGPGLGCVLAERVCDLDGGTYPCAGAEVLPAEDVTHIVASTWPGEWKHQGDPEANPIPLFHLNIRQRISPLVGAPCFAAGAWTPVFYDGASREDTCAIVNVRNVVRYGGGGWTDDQGQARSYRDLTGDSGSRWSSSPYWSPPFDDVDDGRIEAVMNLQDMPEPAIQPHWFNLRSLKPGESAEMCGGFFSQTLSPLVDPAFELILPEGFVPRPTVAPGRPDLYWYLTPTGPEVPPGLDQAAHVRWSGAYWDPDPAALGLTEDNLDLRLDRITLDGTERWRYTFSFPQGTGIRWTHHPTFCVSIAPDVGYPFVYDADTPGNTPYPSRFVIGSSNAETRSSGQTYFVPMNAAVNARAIPVCDGCAEPTFDLTYENVGGQAVNGMLAGFVLPGQTSDGSLVVALESLTLDANTLGHPRPLLEYTLQAVDPDRGTFFRDTAPVDCTSGGAASGWCDYDVSPPGPGETVTAVRVRFPPGQQLPAWDTGAVRAQFTALGATLADIGKPMEIESGAGTESIPYGVATPGVYEVGQCPSALELAAFWDDGDGVRDSDPGSGEVHLAGWTFDLNVTASQAHPSAGQPPSTATTDENGTVWVDVWPGQTLSIRERGPYGGADPWQTQVPGGALSWQTQHNPRTYAGDFRCGQAETFANSCDCTDDDVCTGELCRSPGVCDFDVSSAVCSDPGFCQASQGACNPNTGECEYPWVDCQGGQVAYGLLQNEAGDPVGSIRCVITAGDDDDGTAVACDTDGNGQLAVDPTLWCDVAPAP